MKKSLFIASLLCISLIACSQESKQVTPIVGISVSDFEYTMNEKNAVSINLGESVNNYCDITIYRDLVKTGYSVRAKQKSSNDISATCQWDGKTYFQSSKHPTHAKLKINEINSQSGLSKLTASLHLIDPYKNKYFTLDNVSFELNKELTNNLIKKL